MERFWDSGIKETAQLKAILQRYEIVEFDNMTCVEYGCGLGRVTLPLSKIFGEIHAYDISASHLKMARQNAIQFRRDNIVFHHVTENTLEQSLRLCDFFYSRIVFQHNPPPVIARLIAMSLSSLRERGIGIFQVPTYAANYKFHVDEYLARPESTDMEMHALPQSVVFELIADANCRLLEIREDGSVGRVGQWISNTFVVERHK
jgi:SAM-dependent methyltransferase